MGISLTNALIGPRMGKLLAIEKQYDTTGNRVYTYSGGMQNGFTTTDITILQDNTTLEILCFIPAVAFQNVGTYNDETSFSIGITEVQYSTDAGDNWFSLGWIRCGSVEEAYSFVLQSYPIYMDGIGAGTFRLRFRHGAYNHSETTVEKFVVNNLGYLLYGNAFNASLTVTGDYSTTQYYAHFIVKQYDGNDEEAYPEGSYSSISRRMSEQEPGIDIAYGFELPSTIATCYTNGSSPTITAYSAPFANVQFINERGVYITFPQITKQANTGIYAEIRILAGVRVNMSVGTPPYMLCFAVQYSTDGGSSWSSYGITPYCGNSKFNLATSVSYVNADTYNLPVLLSGFASTTVQFRVEVRGLISDNSPLTDSIKYPNSGSCYIINSADSSAHLGNCGSSISYVELDI